MTIRKYGKKYRVRVAASLTVSSEQDAARFEHMLSAAFSEARRRFLRGDLPCRTLNQVLPEFLEYLLVWRGNSRGTIASYRRRLAAFSRAFGDVPLDAIPRETLQAWIHSRCLEPGHSRRHQPGGTVSRDTVNHDLAALRALCSWAASRGYAPLALEVAAVDPLRVAGKIRGNRFPPRALVRQNFLRILVRIRKASPQVALILRGMLLLGARPEALFALRWSHVQLPRSGVGEVCLPPLKGGAEGSVPLRQRSQARAVFEEAEKLFVKFNGRRPRRSDPVFCTLRGRSRRRRLGWTTDAYDHELARICKKLGVDGFSAYTARHSAVTWLQQQPGVSPAAVQAFARHLRVSTQEAYSHRSGVDGEAAYAAMDGILCGYFGAGNAVTQNADSADLSLALQVFDVAMVTRA